MATIELPLHFNHIPSFSSSSPPPPPPPPKFELKEGFLWRMRFSASSGWRSALVLSRKEGRSRAPCCMSVDVDSESSEADSKPAESRREEKFAVLNTGKWECRSCGYTYDQSTGEPSYPIAAGTEFRQLPDDWRCPTCGAAKAYFNSKSVEVAGFAENQKFGLGTNSLTSGQKSILIYGSLLFFFLLFLSGYFLQ